MDVSNSTSNSIDEIEEYVCSEHPEWLPTGKFSPGHHLQIKAFVEEVCKTQTPVTLKQARDFSENKGKRK